MKKIAVLTLSLIFSAHLTMGQLNTPPVDVLAKAVVYTGGMGYFAKSLARGLFSDAVRLKKILLGNGTLQHISFDGSSMCVCGDIKHMSLGGTISMQGQKDTIATFMKDIPAKAICYLGSAYLVYTCYKQAKKQIDKMLDDANNIKKCNKDIKKYN